MKNSSDMGVRVRSAFALITDCNWRGDFPGSEGVLHLFRALSGSDPGVFPPLAMIMLRVAEATFLMLAGRFAEGFQAVSDGLKISQEAGIPIWDSHLLGFGAMGALSTGDLRTARRYRERMSRNLAPGRNFDRSLYYGLSAWQSLLTGDVSQALSHAGLSHAAARELGATLPEACSHLLLAQILHETGETARAQVHVQDGLRIARRMGSAMISYMGLTAEAQLAFDRGDEISGVNALRSALTLGRQQGIFNLFFWRPGVMTRLCARALEHEIETGYVHDLIRRRNLLPSTLQTETGTWPWPVKIYTLGRFSLLLNGNLVRFTGKTPQKPLSLLKALIILGGRQIREGRLNDLLWPDAEGDNAHKAFSVTLTRLRQRLGLDPAILLSNGSVSLDPARCWVDIWAFERLLTKAASKPSELEKAMQLYKGPLLPGENDPWVIAVRDRLRTRFLTCVHTLTRHYRDEQLWEKAVDAYQSALKAEEEAESLYQGLIRCHLHLGDHSEALQTYRRCEAILAARLGIPPSPQTKALIQPILSSL
ncbi:MAG: hypothetical protein HZA19_07185 [Nitrospirae bacterium]|nr:hypothetical protein [Nitrospirota bacterium]